MLTDEIKETNEDDLDSTFECTCVICGDVSNVFSGGQWEMDFIILKTNRHSKTRRVICKECQQKIRKICDAANISARCEQVDKSILAHAVGVQNVYNEISELKEFYKLATKERPLQKTINEMKEMIEEVMALKEKFEWRLNNQKDSLEKLNKVLEALDN